MQRLPDWPERLVATIAAHRAESFAWGRFDCATIVRDSVRAMTGVDILAEHGRWRSKRGALRVLRASRHASVAAFVAATFPACAPLRAGRGDLGYPAQIASPLMWPAIVLGVDAVSWSETGFVVLPRASLATFYQV